MAIVRVKNIDVLDCIILISITIFILFVFLCLSKMNDNNLLRRTKEQIEDILLSKVTYIVTYLL